MLRQPPTGAAGKLRLEVGDSFNPCGLLNGIFIPEVLVKARGVSPGAKLTSGRFTRYAGENGTCYPAVAPLAAEIGMSERQTQRYLSELERKRFIKRIPPE
jgi:hypothetical protein